MKISLTVDKLNIIVEENGDMFCADYKSVYDYFSPHPSLSHALKQNKLINRLSAAGIWDKIDYFLIANNNETNSLINWKTGNSAANNSTSFTTYQGFDGGGTGYINLNYNPRRRYNVNSDNISFGIYIRDDNVESAFSFGVRNSISGYRTSLIAAQVDKQSVYHLNGLTLTKSSLNANKGLYAASLSGTTLQIYKDGIYLANTTGTPKTIEDLDYYLCCYNLNGNPATYSSKEFSLIWIGESLSKREQWQIYQYIEDYFVSINKSVIDLDTTNYNIVCDGNSLTKGTHLNPGGTTYPQFLAALLPSSDIQNIASDGQTADDMIDTDDGVILYFDPNYQTNILIAWEITNNIYYGDTPQEALDALKEYCLKQKDYGDNKFKIVVLTAIPRGEQTQAGNSIEQFNKWLDEANDLLEQDYPTFADKFVDLRTASELSNYNDTTYFAGDKVHLITAGYQIVANMVLPKIQEL